MSASYEQSYNKKLGEVVAATIVTVTAVHRRTSHCKFHEPSHDSMTCFNHLRMEWLKPKLFPIVHGLL